MPEYSCMPMRSVLVSASVISDVGNWESTFPPLRVRVHGGNVDILDACLPRVPHGFGKGLADEVWDIHLRVSEACSP